MNKELSFNDRTLLDVEMDHLLDLTPEARAQRLIEIEKQKPDQAQHLRAWLNAIEQSEGAFEPPSAAAQETPQQIGPWRVLHLIGRGGMGEVYLGERADGAFVRKVALKFLRHDRASTSKQLGRERHVLARLRHPGIAQLLDGGVTPDKRPYLVMEWVDGTSLDVWVKEKKPNLRTRVKVLKQAAEAVAYAHANLVVHRDLKPGNVMVDQEGLPRLLDFGIARLLEEANNNTLTDDRALTPAIAAPEQFTGQVISTKTDVYALGGLLYWLISGQMPHDTKNLALVDLIQKVCHTDPPAPSSLIKNKNTKISADLDAIALRALAREPEKRYASAEAMAQDLDHWLKGETVSARLPTRWERTQRFVKQNKLAVALTASVFVSLFVGITTTLWQAQRAAQEASKASKERDLALIEAQRSEGLVKNFAQLFRNTKDEKLSASEWLDRATEIAQMPSAVDQLTRTRFLERLAEIENSRGQTARAVTLYEYIVGKTIADLTPMEQSRIRCNLASNYGSLARFEEASIEIKKGLALAEIFQGTDRLQLIECINSQIELKVLQNKVSDQEVQLAERAFAELNLLNQQGDAQLRRTPQLILLARVLRLTKNNKAALTKYDEALLSIQKFGTNDITEHLFVLSSIATVLSDLGRYIDANKRYQQTFALMEKSDGSALDPPSFATTLVNQAAVLNTLGEHDAAEANCRRAIDIFASLKGDRPASIANAYAHLGNALYQKNKFEEARSALNEARNRFILAFGKDNDLEFGVIAAFARLELEAKNIDLAKHYIESVVAHFRAGQPKSQLGQSLSILSRIELAADRYAEAESAIREALVIERKMRGSDLSFAAQHEIQLARVLLKNGKLDEGRSLLNHAIPIMEDSFGSQQEKTIRARELLAEFNQAKR